jgi:hypothetical protein
MQPNLGPLAGYKTYIIAVLLGATAAVKSLGYIDDSTYQVIMGLLGSAGLATMRKAITNHGAPSEK